MTPTEQDLAQQLAQHPLWRWMAGMRVCSPDGWARVDDDRLDEWEGWPDLSCPATRGCLWTKLREEAAPVHVYDESHGIVVECHPGGDRERFTAPTLGEALARALLAADEVVA